MSRDGSECPPSRSSGRRFIGRRPAVCRSSAWRRNFGLYETVRTNWAVVKPLHGDPTPCQCG